MDLDEKALEQIRVIAKTVVEEQMEVRRRRYEEVQEAKKAAKVTKVFLISFSSGHHVAFPDGTGGAVFDAVCYARIELTDGVFNQYGSGFIEILARGDARRFKTPMRGVLNYHSMSMIEVDESILKASN